MTRFYTNQPHQINALLPPEMLHYIFYQLPPRDLKNVVLVCRRWREVGEAGFWAWVILREAVPEVLESRRMKTVREIIAWTDKLLKLMTRHKGLKVLEVSGTVPSEVYPCLMALAVTRLEKVRMEETKLTTQHGKTILTGICQEPSSVGASQVISFT